MESLSQLIAVARIYKPNKIVHLAASIDLESLESYPMQVYHSFVGGTVNVLELMRLLGGVEASREHQLDRRSADRAV